jgi:hypothetical protein
LELLQHFAQLGLVISEAACPFRRPLRVVSGKPPALALVISRQAALAWAAKSASAKPKGREIANQRKTLTINALHTH